MTVPNKDRVKHRIDAVTLGGSTNISNGRFKRSTNLSGGLFKGIQQQIAVRLDEPAPEDEPDIVDESPTDVLPAARGLVQAVFLFTDGLANIGLLEKNEIVRNMTNMLSRSPPPVIMYHPLSSVNTPIFTFHPLQSVDIGEAKATAAAVDSNKVGTKIVVHTFGYGMIHNAQMLQAIANAANGTYNNVQLHYHIPAAVADALGGLLSVCAQNIDIVIKPAMPGVTIRQVGHILP